MALEDARAVMYVKQYIQGRNYVTSWGLMSPDHANDGGQFTEEAWEDLTNSNPGLSDVSVFTNPAAGAGFNPQLGGLVGAIIAFHRIMQSDLVTLKGIYVNDGRKNNSEQSVFASIGFSLPAAGTYQGAGADNPEGIAPASIPLMLERAAAGLGTRPGRCYLRAVLPETDIRLGGDKGVDWAVNSQDSWGSRLASALTSSTLALHFFPTGSQATKVGVPHYYTVDDIISNPELEGQVKSMRPVTSISLQGPTPRQVGRGRRRK